MLNGEQHAFHEANKVSGVTGLSIKQAVRAHNKTAQTVEPEYFFFPIFIIRIHMRAAYMELQCLSFSFFFFYEGEAVATRTSSAAFFAITSGGSVKSTVAPSSSGANGSSAASCDSSREAGM